MRELEREYEGPKGRIAPWLSGPMLKSRPLYARVLVAALLINCFALVTAMFTMTVYDRIVPNNATGSLVGLTIGLGLVLVFDFILKLLRGYFVDLAGARVDRDIGKAIFGRILALRLDLSRHSTGGLAGLVREIETLRDFFASATITALVDVPFTIITLTVIALIGGWLVLVPLVMIPLVILSALATQPMMRRLASQSLDEALGKQSVLVETIGSLETVKSANAGDMLGKRWDEAMVGHANVSLRQRLAANLTTTIATSADDGLYRDRHLRGVRHRQPKPDDGWTHCLFVAGRAGSGTAGRNRHAVDAHPRCADRLPADRRDDGNAQRRPRRNGSGPDAT